MIVIKSVSRPVSWLFFFLFPLLHLMRICPSRLIPLVLSPPLALAENRLELDPPPSYPPVYPALDPLELNQAVAERMMRVPHFAFLRSEAKALGVRIFLFGGTASGFIHYVRWNLLQEKGFPLFYPSYFDYDLTTIYRSSQDLDIVVDGPLSAINTLRERLKTKYPFSPGERGPQRWDLHSLRDSLGEPGKFGYKEALLNGFDFLNQNSDSSSMGLIELTPTSKSDPKNTLVVWDLKALQGELDGNIEPHIEEGTFLRDSADGRITLHISPLHHLTKRYLIGENPPIFSVIRALAKAFQYELRFSEEDWGKIQTIVNEFDPHEALITYSSYTRKRLIDIGKRVLLRSTSIEYTLNILQKLTLKKKLMVFDNPGKMNSLAWWLNREPLRTHSLEKDSNLPEPPTAGSLGIDIVTHETNSFLAFEIMTRSPMGMANALISRESSIGEEAFFGKGFYTQIGKTGGRGTKIAIRFHLLPEAREGIDFFRPSAAPQYVIVLNKAVLKMIPEFVDLSPLEYFQSLLEKSRISRDLIRSGLSQRSLEEEDLISYGALERFRRKIVNRMTSGEGIDPKELAQILKLVRSEVRRNDEFYSHLLKEWFFLETSSHYPYLLKTFLRKGNLYSLLDFTKQILNQPFWENHVEIFLELIDKSDPFLLRSTADFIFSHPIAKTNPQILSRIISTGDHYVLHKIADYILPQPHWRLYPELILALISRNDQSTLRKVAENVLSQISWSSHPELLVALVQRADPTTLKKIDDTLLSLPHWRDHPQIKTFVSWGDLPLSISTRTLRAALFRRKKMPTLQNVRDEESLCSAVL